MSDKFQEKIDWIYKYLQDQHDKVGEEFNSINNMLTNMVKRLDSIDRTLMKHDVLLTNHITDVNKEMKKRLSNIESKIDTLVNKK